jgi:hypothetical protein
MNLSPPSEATDLGSTAQRAFGDIGGTDLTRRAEANNTDRGQVEAVVRSLGLDGLRAGDDPVQLAAAAEVSRAAGRVALPYPLTSLLSRHGDNTPPVALVDLRYPLVNHADLFPEWSLWSISGQAFSGRPMTMCGTPLAPFACSVQVERTEPVGDPWLIVLLSSAEILGTVERALELTTEHVSNREQFGQQLSRFQVVQFQLADAAVEIASLRELLNYTIWRRHSAPEAKEGDSLALRYLALDVAGRVMRTAHQLHGAMGFCDEHDVSVLSRHVQSFVRVSGSIESTIERLEHSASTAGFDSLFSS